MLNKPIMETNEKKIKEFAERIVDAVINLSLGKEPKLFSNSVFKSISKHPNFIRIKNLIIEHLQFFDGIIETTDEWKRVNDFRFKLIELYENKPI